MSETRPAYTVRPLTCGTCRYCLGIGANPLSVCTLHGVGVCGMMPACRQWKEDTHD